MGSLAGVPLSSPQEQIWLHQELLPDAPLYNIGGVLQIDGELSVDLLEGAIHDVVAGADALCMVLVPADPLPRQVFDRALRFRVARHDFSACADPAAAAQQWSAAEFRRRFSLHGGPLFDFALLRLSPTRLNWFYTFHHLVNDGWGISVFMQRVAARYATLAGEHRKPAAAGSYAEFVAAERAYLGSSRYEEDREYWGERLRHPPEPLVRAHGRVVPSGHREWTIDRRFYDALNEWCRSADASVFHVLLAALVTYLARVGGSRDVIVGVPALNRRTARDKATIGVYAGLKPARFSFDPRQSASAFVHHIRAALARDYRHYRFPLARMPRGQAVLDRAQAGLFDVVLSYEHHDYDATFEGRAVHMTALENGFEQNGVAIFVREYHRRRDVAVHFNYNLAAFSDTEIASLTAGLDVLVHQIVERPDRALGSLSITSPEARAVATGHWAAGETRPAAARCVHQWIAGRARRQPDAIAAICGDECVTYRDLDERANGLAWRLRAAGVGPETRVGIALGRTPDLLVGVLAVLKAGGAYVPIDPGHPAERIEWMIGDAGVRLVLCESSDVDHITPDMAELIALDPSERAPAPPAAAVDTDNLAYVIYTSGSTGRPKGVMVSHGSIANYLAFAVEVYQLSPASGTVPLHSAPGFDATLTSMLAPLVAGACIETLPGPNGLAALCEAMHAHHEFSVVKITPSHLGVLEEELGRRQSWARPRVLVLGGEALDDAALQFWRVQAPHTRIFNEYGPTEAAVGCSVFEIADPPSNGATPIGRPVWNTRLYVLDDEMQPVPPGTVGELYIGGPGLARGYAGRPGLTAERFLADPFATAPGARVYRTGDLVRHDADGCLTYVGRRDTQVKLRGHRVELGEIEAVMRTHTAVRDIAVTLEEDETGHPRLIAYVISAGAPSADAEELRRHARRWLPQVMVPSAWAFVDHLPLTAHGKLDRQQLTATARSRVDARGDGAAERPRTPIEEALVTLWSDVLGVHAIGIHDNFFDLRGDSILALRIVARARAAGIDIGLPEIFRHQTVAELAGVARRTVAGPGGEREAEAPAAGVVPLTPIQCWFLEQQPPDVNDFAQVAEFDIAPTLEPHALETALAAVVAHHDALRLRLRRTEGGWTQTIGEGDAGPLLTVEHLNGLPDAAANARIEESLRALRRRLDLASGPILGGVLCLRDDDRDARLFLAAHHAAVDVVSWQILMDDINVWLEQRAAGRAAFLGSPASFARWARQLADESRRRDARAELAGLLALRAVDHTFLPGDLDRPGENTVGASQIVELSGGPDASASMVAAAAAAYQCRIDELLITALVRTVARLDGRRSLVVHLETHGRDAHDLDLSRTVGWLTRLVPFRVALPPDTADGAAVVEAVTAQVRAGLRAGEAFGALRYVHPDPAVRSTLASLPTPDLLLNYVGRVDGGAGAGAGLRALRSLRLFRDERSRRQHRIEIDAMVSDGKLRMQWTFGRHLHSRAAIERAARLVNEELATIVATSPRRDARPFTSNDFPGARLGQQELDIFLARFR